MTTTPIEPGPLVYAHRGDRTRARDNTLEAYRLAIEAGADGVELDVRGTKDGVLILHHDDRDETVGVLGSVTFAEIRQAAPHIPTLREALDTLPGDRYINVEIKTEMSGAGLDSALTSVEKTIAEISEFDDPARILLSSFAPEVMKLAGQVGPEFLRGQLIRPPVSLKSGIALAVSLGMDAINLEFAYLRDETETSMKAISDAGLRAVVWGIDSPDDVAAMVAAGVAVIITDDPGMARRVVDQS